MADVPNPDHDGRDPDKCRSWLLPIVSTLLGGIGGVGFAPSTNGSGYGHAEQDPYLCRGVELESSPASEVGQQNSPMTDSSPSRPPCEANGAAGIRAIANPDRPNQGAATFSGLESLVVSATVTAFIARLQNTSIDQKLGLSTAISVLLR